MELLDLLARNKKRMDDRIFSVLPESHSDRDVDNFYQMMRDYPTRKGKGIRGNLCLLSCGMFGGTPDRCLDTAAAIELFESWVLIHDDIEDGSDMRRGEVTLHLKHGIPLAINAGDSLHNRMWQLLLRNRETLGVNPTFRIAEEFMHMINQTTEGQHIELSWTENGRFNLSEEDYYAMCMSKTAWYTCISPLRLGGMIGGAQDTLLESMVDVGTYMGLAFQIQDDVLNLVGDEKKYGKEIYGDIREGKRTLVLIHVLSNADATTRKQVMEAIAKRREDKTEDDVRLVVGAMQNCGSMEYAKGKATELARQAREKFDSDLSDVPESPDKQRIRDIIDFVVKRDK
jgi:geranylgeranyl diphosphate synthase type II